MRGINKFKRVALFLLAFVYMPAFAERIEEAAFVEIGGIEQWVTIRGDDDSSPVLLLLHGGPGDVQSPFVSTYAPYEKDFVLVQWDQRGAGRTFARSGAADLTLERLIADGIELSEWLHERFPGRKLILFGHSWGSIIATGIAQQRPDLFGAYVGTGQASTWDDTVRFQFAFLEQRYRDDGNTSGLAALEAIGNPDPKNPGQYFGFSRPLRQYMNPSDTAWFAQMQATAMANGETDATLKATSYCMGASGAALIRTLVTTNLQDTALSFARYTGSTGSFCSHAPRRGLLRRSKQSEETDGYHRGCRPFRAGDTPECGHSSANKDASLECKEKW
jgi:pimeloyl-ACP methyl ester carboxylesterase